MKDRIQNPLGVGDKVLVELPTASVIGVISQVEEPSVIAIRRGQSAAAMPGRVIVAVMLALPVDPESGAAPQLVKVYDADRKGPVLASIAPKDTSGPSTEN